ncbi:MAG: ABC transporter permease [Anaerolineales bacterium]|nr:ABC transporter permease [Anaerolineales bacterium]
MMRTPFSFRALIFLVFRNLTTRWVRTVLTMLGIIVGVGAMVAVSTTNDSTMSAIDRFFDETAGRSDLLVESSVAGETFVPDVAARVARTPDVLAVAPSVLGVTIPADEADGWEDQFGIGGTTVPGTNFWLMGRDVAADTAVHDYKLVSGRLLQPDETAYSVVLVSDYAAEKGVDVGEDFAILTPGEGVVRLRIVGLIAKEGIGLANDGVLGIAPLSVVQGLFNYSDELMQLDIVVAPAVADDSAALDALRQRLGDQLGADFSVKYPASRGEAVADSLQTYQLGLNFFSVVSLFVGSFLIYNAFAMTIVERTREIGMFRAIGMTRRQIGVMVLIEAAILGLFGALLGAGFGLLLARFLTDTVSRFSGQRVDQIAANPIDLLQAVLIGVVVTILAAMLPARQAATVSPLQALRVQGRTDEGRLRMLGLRYGPLTVTASLLLLYRVPLRDDVVFMVGSNSIFALLLGATLCIPLLIGGVERVLRPLTLFLFGQEGQLGSRNIQRAPARTALTVAALMIGISMVVGIQGMTLSFENDIMEWVDIALGGDLFVESPLEMRPDLEARLLALDEVDAVTKSRFVPSRMFTPGGKDEYAVFVAIDPTTYLDVRSIRVQVGPEPADLLRELAAGGAIWVSVDVADRFDLAVGDTVLLETKRGRQPFRVAAVVVDFGGGQTTTVTGSWGDLRRYFGVTDVSSFGVRLTPGASLAEVTEIIENDLGRGQNLGVESKAEFEQKVRQLSADAFSLFDVLGLIGLVVGALGVINTMLMNVLERTRELGGLRSLGMTRGQVRRMIMAEAATIGVMGGLFGVLSGAVLADVFLIGLRAVGGFALTLRTPYEAMGISFGLSLLLALGAALYPAWRASRINIISAVKHE